MEIVCFNSVNLQNLEAITEGEFLRGRLCCDESECDDCSCLEAGDCLMAL